MQRTLSKVMNAILQPVPASPAPSLGLEDHDQALTQSLVSTPITQPEAADALAKTPAVKKPRKTKTTPKTTKPKSVSKPSLSPSEIKTAKTAKAARAIAKPKAKADKAANPENTLSVAEAKQWTACRAKLNESDESSAEALTEILEKRLYREKYRSFEKFVQAECSSGKAYAYRLIQAHKTLQASTLVDGQKPTNIAQAIALAAAPEAKYPEVMREAVKLAGTGKLTTAHIKNAIKLVDPKPKAPGKANADGGEGAGATKPATPQPVKKVDALGWVTSLRASIKDPAKVEDSLRLLELIELALESNTLIDAPAGKPAAVVTK